MDSKRSCAEQIDKVVGQWMKRLPEYRAVKDPFMFAREMGVEISPSEEKEFLQQMRLGRIVADLGDQIFGSEPGIS